MRQTRVLVVVLQAMQPLGADLLASFPAEDFDVRVLTSGEGPAPFRPGTANLAPVEAAARDAWEQRLRDLARQHEGRIELVTNDEYCLLDCAALRAALCLPARHPAGLEAYRDKVAMKERVAAVGVDVPRHVALGAGGAATADRLIAELELPLVVKPRREANNRGVEVIAERAHLAAWLTGRDGLGDWQAEAFVAGRQCHANALVEDGRITPLLVGEYTDSLLALGRGAPVGSITLAADDAATHAGVRLNERVLAALGTDGRFVVHTEFVLTTDGRAVLLETAARAPGALVSEMAALHVGVHLEQANLRAQAGAPSPRPRATGLHAAWVWFPTAPDAGVTVRRPQLRSDYRLQLLPAGSPLGASLVAWNADAAALRADLADLHAHPVTA